MCQQCGKDIYDNCNCSIIAITDEDIRRWDEEDKKRLVL